jgi:hypothetical protein
LTAPLPGIKQLKIERKAGDSALIGMTQNVAALLDVKSRKSQYPKQLNEAISIDYPLSYDYHWPWICHQTLLD